MRIMLVADDGSETDMTEDFRVTYDTAVGSMDFGSGFLSTEEVDALHRVAKAIGADRAPYQHDKCTLCNHDRERHTTERCWTTSDGDWWRRYYEGGAPDGACACPGFDEGDL